MLRFLVVIFLMTICSYETHGGILSSNLIQQEKAKCFGNGFAGGSGSRPTIAPSVTTSANNGGESEEDYDDYADFDVSNRKMRNNNKKRNKATNKAQRKVSKRKEEQLKKQKLSKKKVNRKSSEKGNNRRDNKNQKGNGIITDLNL